MARADDLFIRLSDTGCNALDEMILEGELESLFLDFKQSSDGGASRHLSVNDNKNLSKAISGFANSSGGVIVWGVDCRRELLSGNEVATKAALIDACGFSTKLQGAVSRATVPPHPGIQIAFFKEPGASPAGYVAVLIPRSAIGPLRSVATNHYHMRSGSDFGIVSHDVLAGMFGRAPQPQIDLNILSQPARLNSPPGHLTLSFGICAVNLGAVVGERPYLSVAYGDIPSNLIFSRCPDLEAFSLRRGLLPVFSAVAKPGIVLPPGSSEHICDVEISTPLGQPRSINLDCTLGVLGAPPRRFLLTASEASIQAAMEQAPQASLQTTVFLMLQPQS